MEDIRRKCNPNVDLSKFTSNIKNIEWSCSLSLQPSLLSNFVQCLITLGLKKIHMVTNFFKDKKIRIFFRNLYIIIIMLSMSGWSFMTTLDLMWRTPCSHTLITQEKIGKCPFQAKRKHFAPFPKLIREMRLF